MSLFEKFVESATKIDTKKVRAGVDMIGHSLPWVVGISCVFGGVYGLETYLAIDFSKNVRDNLKKNKELSDLTDDFYTILGYKTLTENEYIKAKNKNMGKVSDANSILAEWKSVYDK